MAVANNLRASGVVTYNAFMLKCVLHKENAGGAVVEENKEIELTLFPDGRAIIKGTSDPGVARGIYARYIGS